ncbi:MAG: Fe-S cluster assembly protein SufD, partial [Acetobacteraceae bacterium]
MTADAPSGVAGFLARYDGLRDRLGGDRAMRDAAAESFRRLGLPGARAGRRDEAWKYTSLRPVAEASFHEPLTSVSGDGAALANVPRIAAARIVFIDGWFRPELSEVPTPLGFRSFAERPRFGTSAQPDREPMVALNTMLAEDGAQIDVPEGTDAGIVQLVSLGDAASGLATAFHPRHAIRLGRNSRLVLIETSGGSGVYLHNPVAAVEIAEGATLVHVRLQDEAAEAFHLSTVYAEIAERGTYDSFVLNVGARLTRTEIHARLAGAGAMVHLNGAQLLRGLQQADFTSVVRHDAPSCGSRQTVKNVLAGRSRGVFQGRIEVARAAQKTDGYQMSQTLLLSPDAEVDTKPELEIFADDVKCSHGATVGELDHEQLFYLRTRGIPESDARAILIRAFLTEALDVVGNDAARAALEDAVEQWWEREA